MLQAGSDQVLELVLAQCTAASREHDVSLQSMPLAK
jgi:hypothetical protein